MVFLEKHRLNKKVKSSTIKNIGEMVVLVERTFPLEDLLLILISC